MSAKKKAPSQTSAQALAAQADTATPADLKSDAVYGCIVKIFQSVGLPHISTPDAKIVWSTLTDPANIIDQLGNGIRDCIIGKGFQCDGLAGLFAMLQSGNKVTTVSALQAIIEQVVS